MQKPIPISFLDLAPIPQGATATSALQQTVSMAQAAEKYGFNRYWLAEHHNMPGIASSATSVLLAYIGSQTQHIRIGSGGVMLPNHAPLVIAEQFGTLAILYPNRIDLGLGRAPGTDGATFRALRRTHNDADHFPQDVQELLHYLNTTEPSTVRAIPGQQTHVPIWILGSSLFGAQLAAHFGLPYAFASHFAPQMLEEAVGMYRRGFKPSQYLAEPYVMVAANLLLAEDEATARYHFNSSQQSFVNLRRGMAGQIPPPIPDMMDFWTIAEKSMVESALSIAFVGSVASVKPDLEKFLNRLQPDELIVTCNIYDNTTRLHSLSLVEQLNLFDLKK